MSAAPDPAVAAALRLPVHAEWQAWRGAVRIPEDVRQALEAAIGPDGVAALSKPPAATYARVISGTGSSSSSAAVDCAVERLHAQGLAVARLAGWHAALGDCIRIYPGGAGGGDHRREEEEEDPVAGVVVCSRVAAEAVLRGADLFAQGVLAMSLGLDKGCRVAIAAPLGWQLEGRLTRGMPIPSEAFAQAVSSSSSSSFALVGRGVLEMARRGVFQQQASGTAVRLDRALAPPGAHQLGGELLLQNLSSMVAASALDVRPQHAVLDLCAAPGHKARRFADIVCSASPAQGGLLIACERAKSKLGKLRASIQSAIQAGRGLALAVDSTKLAVGGAAAAASRGLVQRDWQFEAGPSVAAYCRGQQDKHSSGSEIAGLHTDQFDRVLCDVPCTALGLRPRLSYEGCPCAKSIESTAAYQRQFLEVALRLAKKPGGEIVYSTCSVTLAENEGVVAEFLRDHEGEVQVVPHAPFLASPGVPVPGLDDRAAALCQRFMPQDSSLDTIGMFVAKFRVVGERVGAG